MAKAKRLAVLLCAGAMMTGCASFRDGPTMAGEWPAGDGGPPATISYAVNGETVLNGARKDLPPGALEKWHEAVAQAYGDSGLFGEVREGFHETDYRAEIEVRNEGRFNQVLAFICGFSFFVIPAKSTDEFIVETTFRNAANEVVGTVQSHAAMDTWIHLLLIPVMPFKFPFAEAPKAMYDVQKSTLLEAERRGFFEGGPAVAKGG